MDEKLVFNLLIAARGYRATIQSVDPENGDFSVSLKKQAAIKDLPDNRKATGIVVDEKGEPVFGAQVYITGAKQGDRKWWGQVRNIDKVAITDKDGKFVLTSDADFEQWQFSVYAAGFVKSSSDHLPTGDHNHKFKLDPGCTVTGTVKKNGKPVAGLRIGMCQKDRSGINWVGEKIISTDKNGQFMFNSVLANDTFYVYAKMTGPKKKHTIEIAEFDSVKTGKTKALGDFDLLPTFSCEGQVVLLDEDGKELRDPEAISLDGQKMFVNRKYAWDHQVIKLKPDGFFAIECLPQEPVKIAVRVPGYVYSKTKNQFQLTGENEMGKLIEGDIKDLKIYLEPK